MNMKNKCNFLIRIISDLRKYGPGIAAAVLAYFLMHRIFHVFCPMVLLTGFPCPGCGLTRSILYLLQGKVQRSLNIQPMGIVIVFFAAYCFFFRYVRGKKIPGFKTIGVGIILSLWVLYIVNMYLYFPDKPPYTYNSQNVLSCLTVKISQILRGL